jgi:misacylated tRNA(Ala) deacylase
MGVREDLVRSFRWVDGHADVWRWFSDGELFGGIVGELSDPFRGVGVTKVAAVEARGFLLAGAVAKELGAGVLGARKQGGALPGRRSEGLTSPDYRGRRLTLVMRSDLLADDDRVLLVDDWMETGSQALAARALIEGMGATFPGLAVIVRDGTRMEVQEGLRRLHVPDRCRRLRFPRCATFGAMTDQLFAEDAYLTSCEATVVDIRDEGVVLDRTVFYARGGGQPGDTGTLRWEGGLVRIIDTVKMGGDIVHQVEGDAPLVGHSVTAEIDWARRHRLMRTHTALHSLSGVIFRDYGAKVTGGNMDDTGSARMDFELDEMSQELGKEIEAKLNEELNKNRPVHVSFLPRAEALADPELIRTKVSLIPEFVDPIRVIDIEGIDKQADGGTHVKSTGEIGHVAVVKTESKGKAFKRMRIQLDD